MHGEWEKFGISEQEYFAVKNTAEELMLRAVIREFVVNKKEKDFLIEIGKASSARKGLKKMKNFFTPEEKKKRKDRQKKFIDAEKSFKTLNTRIKSRLKDWDKLISNKGQDRVKSMMKMEINKLKNTIKKYGSDLEQVEDKNHPAYQELNNLISSYSDLAKKYSGKKLKKGTKIIDVLGGIGFNKEISDGILKIRNPWKNKSGGSSKQKGSSFFKGDTSITKRFDTILGKKSMQPMKMALSQIKSRKGTAAAFKHFMDELPPDAKKHLPLVIRDILGNLKK